MANNKSIKELVIKVSQRNATKINKDIGKISESLLEASEYADLLNEALSSIKVPKGVNSLIKTMESMETSLQEIAKQTRYTTNSLGAMRNEALEIADAYQESFQVISEGLDDVASDALRTGKKAEAAIDGVTQATREGTKATKGSTSAQGRLGNAMKDTNRQGANQSRQFSKMASSAGGLASVYAIVAANVFALSEGFRILSDAAAVDRLEEVSSVISAGIGVSVAGTAQAMREATDDTISYQAALRQAAAATAYGFDTEQITDFTLVARRAAVVLGVEMTDALNRVIKGISKAEVELLDELGVTVRLNEAYARYANTHNIAATSLNSFQRQQALANEVILKSAQNLGSADSALQSTSWEVFGANVSSAVNRMLRLVSTSEVLTTTLNALNRVLDSFEYDNRADATETPFTRTLKDADTALNKIVAYNNLNKESMRLDKERADTQKKIEDLRSKGALSGKAGMLLSVSAVGEGSNELREYIDELDLMEDKLAAIDNEIKLTKESQGGFAQSLGVSVSEVNLTSDSIQNLSLLSKSFGSDLTSLNNDLKGKATNPYLSIGSAVAEAEQAIESLRKKNFELSEILSKLKIDKDQYNNFGDIKKYVALLDEQSEAMLVNKKAAEDILEPTSATLFLEQEKLGMLKEEHAAMLAVLDISTLTVEQRDAEFTAEQRVLEAKKAILSVEQRRSMVDVKRAASAIDNDSAAGLYIAQQELDLVNKRIAAEMRLAKTAEMTTTQKEAQLAAELKKLAAIKAVQADNYSIMGESRSSAQKSAEVNAGHQSAIGAARDRLAIEQQIYEIMLAANAEAESMGIDAPYGTREIDSQRTADINAGKDLEGELKGGNVEMQQAALSSLSPDLASSTTAVFALADAWAVMGDSSSTAAQTAQAAASAIGSGLDAIGGLVSAAAGMAASSIDLEIAALENSGLTQEEQEAKTKELNKKKIKEQEKYAKASILISTAQGMMLAFATSGNIYAGIALAAMTAAAGAMAYQQASNSASSQLASLGSSSSSTPTSLTVGDQNEKQKVDISNSASSSERAQSLGDSGIYGRASYGKMHAGKSYLLGEHGKELITPKVDSTVSRVDEDSSSNSSGSGKTVHYTIQAIDAESFAQRMDTLGPVMEEYYEQQGRKLAAT